jgi:hypothetical protein
MQQQRKLWLYYWDLGMFGRPKLFRLYRAWQQMLYHYHLNHVLVRKVAARVAQSWERGSTVWKKRSRGSRPRSLVLGVLSGRRACRAAVLLRRRGSRWCPVVHSVFIVRYPFCITLLFLCSNIPIRGHRLVSSQHLSHGHGTTLLIIPCKCTINLTTDVNRPRGCP